jgi:hypothetical protein
LCACLTVDKLLLAESSKAVRCLATCKTVDQVKELQRPMQYIVPSQLQQPSHMQPQLRLEHVSSPAAVTCLRCVTACCNGCCCRGPGVVG